jgi:dihydroorotate dehydrogenase
MGWYTAVGRPAFFSLPPETAHRIAAAALDLPLPWERIGGAFRDPALATGLSGVPVRNPVGLAAGFDKTCRHLGALGRLGFGYVVGGTITRRARTGNSRPRIARSPATRSIVNAMGLPNPGADAAAEHLRRDEGPAPRVVSFADEGIEDAVASLELLGPVADAVELNASCPNVSWGRDRDNEAHLRELLTSFRARTEVPIIVKLPPFVTEIEREVVLALAGVAVEAGAHGLTCSNTRLVRDPRVAMGTGGLSGKAVWPHTPRIVAEVGAATGREIPIHACGGIFSADDVVACLEAGASTVQVYSALIYEGPGIVGSLTRGLSKRLRDRGLVVADLVGTAH